MPPTSDYVALGMVATHVEEPPSVRTVYCVPVSWVDEAPELCKQIWTDAGSSGKPGSLWAAGTLNMLIAVAGNGAPGEGKSWRLKRSRWTLSDDYVAGDGGEPPPPPPPE